jgi:hypothetical protein
MAEPIATRQFRKSYAVRLKAGIPARSVGANKDHYVINRVPVWPSWRAEQVRTPTLGPPRDDCPRIVNNRED